MRKKNFSIINFLTLILVVSVIGPLTFFVVSSGFQEGILKVNPSQELSSGFSPKDEYNFSLLARKPQPLGSGSSTNYSQAKGLSLVKKNTSQSKLKEDRKELPFSPGERITYDLSYKGIKIGKSVLTFFGERVFNSKKVYFITFYTSTPYFKDLEKIFADKKTFLPLRIEREIKRFGGFTTTIKEDYNQKDYIVKITKKGAIFSKKFTIDKKSAIHNAILLSYYYRTRNNFQKNEEFLINLPTRSFKLVYKGKKLVSTPLRESLAYIFEADNRKFRLWLEDDTKKIPLKIDVPKIFGYSLVARSIE